MSVAYRAREVSDPDATWTDIHEAASPEEAAELYVREREWARASFPVAAGERTMRVEVETNVRNVPTLGAIRNSATYDVGNDPGPHYVATEVAS